MPDAVGEKKQFSLYLFEFLAETTTVKTINRRESLTCVISCTPRRCPGKDGPSPRRLTLRLLYRPSRGREGVEASWRRVKDLGNRTGSLKGQVG